MTKWQTTGAGEGGAPMPSITIIERVARMTGRDQIELRPLNEVVDPGALNTLLDGPRDADDSIEISFVYEGVELTIAPDGIRHAELVGGR